MMIRRSMRDVSRLALVPLRACELAARPDAWRSSSRRRPRQTSPSGWHAAARRGHRRRTRSPVDAKVLATGKAIFKDKCQKCHGPGGLGDGPDADPDAPEDMDLTNAKRAERNSDGVVFYKVWNGRKKPKMPAFKDELTKEQVWAVVAYAQTLRKP